MISKVITGKSFYGVCRYVCKDEKRAEVLEACGVRSYDYKLMSADFELQQSMKPNVKNAVFHGILSFYPGEKVTDELMVKVAKEYLDDLNIKDTQFCITKHIDKMHQHVHVLANLVNNKGEKIKDNWIGLKGKKIAQALTKKYGLVEANRKDLQKTNLENLNDKEAAKYSLYETINAALPKCKTLDELKERLEKQNVEVLYKFKGQTTELQGISFKIGEYKFKGSEVDRQFSLGNLQKVFEKNNQHLFAVKEKSEEGLQAGGADERAHTSGQHHSKDLAQEYGKIRGQSNSRLLEALLRPEQQVNQPDSLLPKKKKKKWGRRL